MKNNLEAAKSGDRRRALEQLRDTLAGLLDTTEAQVHAQIAAQYRARLADLAALEKRPMRTAVDELEERRQRGRITTDAATNT